MQILKALLRSGGVLCLGMRRESLVTVTNPSRALGPLRISVCPHKSVPRRILGFLQEDREIAIYRYIDKSQKSHLLGVLSMLPMC